MRKLFSAIIFLLVSITAYSQGASACTGNWYTANEESIIKIYESGGKYYGEIHWVEEPKDEDGNYKKDEKKKEGQATHITPLRPTTAAAFRP